MRVVFDARHLQTVSRTRGIGRYSRNLLEAFARRAPDDIAWTLLTLRNFPPAEPSPLPVHLTRSTIRFRRPELSMLMVDPLLLPFELAGQGDLYHSVQLGLPAPWSRSGPVVLTLHDLAPLHWPAHYLRLPYARIGHAWQYALAKRADAIIAVSEATKADVVARLGVAPERVRVIPEAVDQSFRPPSRDAGAKVAHDRFGVPGRYVLYVGQFDPRKNMDGLFSAFARAAEREPDLRLVIVGTLGRLAPLMRDALARSRVDPSRVVITGGVDDPTLAALYAGAEALLHAAWLEGFGLTPLESLAAGTPVVGYRAGAVAEVVGDAGLLVDERDPDALGEALVTLLASSALQADLRSRAKPRAARFSWDRAADDTLAVYRSLYHHP